MISTDECIGCQACVECCPVQAISFTYDLWGDGKAHVNLQKCVNCSRCDNVCPAKKMELNPEQKNVFAVVSKKNARKGLVGSFLKLHLNFWGTVELFMVRPSMTN